MKSSEYLDEVRRTVSPGTQDLLHSAMGCATEAGELLDQLKKKMFYHKQLDEHHLIEEFGDILWYVVMGLDAVDSTIEEAMEANIRKLRQRYPEKWTQEDALTRDLDAERIALERG